MISGSLFVAQTKADGDPLGPAGGTLLGPAEPAPASDVASVREIYVARQVCLLRLVLLAGNAIRPAILA